MFFSEKMYKTKFKAWKLAKYIKIGEAEQIVNGGKQVRQCVRPDADLEQTRVRAERAVKRRRVSRPATTQQYMPMRPEPAAGLTQTSPRMESAVVLYPRSQHIDVTPQISNPSIEMIERFLFNLRDYTDEAYVSGHWNAKTRITHFNGRQASRQLSSELTAGTALSKNGDQQLAQRHWDRALATLRNPNLLKTWYHEAPIRLLFEIARLVHRNQHELAARLIREIAVQANIHLDRNDTRHALFSSFGELQVSQLKDLYERAAFSLREGLESRIQKHDPLLYEVRLNRALDLSWYDPRTDLTKWLPPVKEIDQALGPDNPYSVYFLLLDAYRLVASGSYDDADQVCSEIDSRLARLRDIPGRIDLWKIALAYRRLGRQLEEQGRWQNARRTFNTALLHLKSVDKDKPSVLLEIYQYQERLAARADDQQDVKLWKQKLQRLEESVAEEAEHFDTPQRRAMPLSEAPDISSVFIIDHIDSVHVQHIAQTNKPPSTEFPSATDPCSAVTECSYGEADDMDFVGSMLEIDSFSHGLGDTMLTMADSFFSMNDLDYTTTCATTGSSSTAPERSPRSMTF